MLCSKQDHDGTKMTCWTEEKMRQFDIDQAVVMVRKSGNLVPSEGTSKKT